MEVVLFLPLSLSLSHSHKKYYGMKLQLQVASVQSERSTFRLPSSLIGEWKIMAQIKPVTETYTSWNL